MANLVKREGGLTRRESEVCDLVCQGKANKEIARTLGIGYRTVEYYRLNITRKMNVPNSVALVHKVLSARIAELEAAYGAN